jgi:hypothetical protein
MEDTGNSMTKNKLKRKVNEAMEIMTKLEEVHGLYDELNKITLEIKDEDLTPFGLTVVDNFEESNVCFRSAAVLHYQIKRTRRTA